MSSASNLIASSGYCYTCRVVIFCVLVMPISKHTDETSAVMISFNPQVDLTNLVVQSYIDTLSSLGQFHRVDPFSSDYFSVRAIVPCLDENYLKALLQGLGGAVPLYNIDIAIVDTTEGEDAPKQVEFTAYCMVRGGASAKTDFLGLALGYLGSQAGVSASESQVTRITSSETSFVDTAYLKSIEENLGTVCTHPCKVEHFTVLYSLSYYADEDMGWC